MAPARLVPLALMLLVSAHVSTAQPTVRRDGVELAIVPSALVLRQDGTWRIDTAEHPLDRMRTLVAPPIGSVDVLHELPDCTLARGALVSLSEDDMRTGRSELPLSSLFVGQVREDQYEPSRPLAALRPFRNEGVETPWLLLSVRVAYAWPRLSHKLPRVFFTETPMPPDTVALPVRFGDQGLCVELPADVVQRSNDQFDARTACVRVLGSTLESPLTTHVGVYHSLPDGTLGHDVRVTNDTGTPTNTIDYSVPQAVLAHDAARPSVVLQRMGRGAMINYNGQSPSKPYFAFASGHSFMAGTPEVPVIYTAHDWFRTYVYPAPRRPRHSAASPPPSRP